jgi:hypothetical protein
MIATIIVTITVAIGTIATIGIIGSNDVFDFL